MNARPWLILVCGFALAGPAAAGNLDAPAAPTAPGGGAMYTLQDLCTRLQSGAAGALRTGPFAEPTGGPSGTMCTLNDIMAAMPMLDNPNGATAADVLSGKTFWGLTNSEWGMKTGTVTAGVDVTGANGQLAITIPNGLYAGSKTATVNDSNLMPGNIKAGAMIFGVSGNPNVVDTSGGTAAAGEILSGKLAYVQGRPVTGTATAGTNVTGTNGQLAITIPDGLYVGGKTATARDTSLVSANIKAGVTIFGTSGNSNVVDTSGGTAVAGEILSGKKAYVAGNLVTGTVTAGSNVTGADGQLTITIPNGLYTGSKTATASDTDLTAGNIKSGVNLFGVTGTYGCSCTYPLISGRWCDNHNGTITDISGAMVDGKLVGRCLVWLRNTSWGGNWPWSNTHDKAASLSATTGDAGLSDGSVRGDWRMPTLSELRGLTVGGTYIYAFPSGGICWSSTPDPDSGYTAAWFLLTNEGVPRLDSKTQQHSVWPVRGGQ